MNINFLRKVITLLVMALSVSFPVFSQSRKSVSILGDSYSTFENFVEPSGNALWYFNKPDLNLTDVNNVKQTWWHQFISKNGFRLEKNNA